MKEERTRLLKSKKHLKQAVIIYRETIVATNVILSFSKVLYDTK